MPPTSAHTASSTHWPSWSQAPFWWGSPKSPTTIGPSTARDDLGQGDLARARGPARSRRPRPRFERTRPGALEGEQDLLEVGLGQPGALGDVAHRGRRLPRRRAAPATAARGWRSRPGSTPSPPDRTGSPRRSAGGGRRRADQAARGPLAWADGRSGRGLPGGPGDGRDPWAISRCSRTTAGPASPTSCRAARAHGLAAAWLPAAAVDADQVVLLVLDGLGLGAARRTAGASRPRCGAWPAGRSPRRPVDHGHRADVDRHRPDPRRARRRRLPHRRRRRGPQRPALDRPPAGDARQPHPAREVPAARRRSAASARRSSPRPSSRARASRGAHLDAGPVHTATACRRRSSPRSGGCCGPASRSSTRTTTGIDKVAHEYGLGEHYDAELAVRSTASSRRPARRAARGRRAVVTADHGQVDVGDNVVELRIRRHAATCRSSRARAGSAGCTPAPGRAAALLDAAAGAATATTPGCVTRDETIDEGWFGPVVTDAAAGPARRRGPRGPGDVAFDDPADTGPFAGRPARLADRGRDAACRCLAGTRP